MAFFFKKRREPVNGETGDFTRVVRQSQLMSCGAAALATFYREVLHRPVTEADLLERLESGEPATLLGLQNLCQEDGLKAHGYAADPELLARLGQPAILHLNPVKRVGHFVVLRGMSGDSVWIADPALGNRHLSLKAFRKTWMGKGKEGRALYVALETADWLPLAPDRLPAAPDYSRKDWFPPASDAD